VKILKEEGFGTDGGKAVGGRGGVVHSWTGTAPEASELVRMREALFGAASHPILACDGLPFQVSLAFCMQAIMN